MRLESVNAKQVNAALKKLPDFAKVRVQEVADVTAFQFERGAKTLVRVASGRLQRAIEWESRPRSLSAVVGINDQQAFYWKFVEYGTVHMDAQPFMRPTAMALEPDHDRRLQQELDKSLTDMLRAAGQ